MRRIPIFATLIVLAAVATMVGLGIWQWERAQWKANLLVHYAEALDNPDPVPFPARAGADAEGSLYRLSSVDCPHPTGEWSSIAGHNADGEVGYVQIASCPLEGGGVVPVQLGWSKVPNPPEWSGGHVTGRIAPFMEDTIRLIADEPQAGLQANASPDPQDLPNNHMAYVVQWFFFALTALVIYILALRKRWRGELAQRDSAD